MEFNTDDIDCSYYVPVQLIHIRINRIIASHFG
jgi:hypothetical protein